MRNFTSIIHIFLLHVFITAVAGQDVDSSLPQCALACAKTIPDAMNQTLVCTSVDLQMEIGACVKKSCTVKESLITQNVTANGCKWPRRDQSSLCKNVVTALQTLATIAVAARITSRLPRYSGPLGTDDYIIVFTWMLLVSFTTMIWIISDTGLGTDIWTVPFNNITLTLEYFNVLTYIYILLTWLTKISILFLYLRLFPDVMFRNIVKVTIVLCCMAGTSFFVACILRCHPVDFAWTFWDGEHRGKCSNILVSAQGWPHVSVNIFADLVVLCLPLPTIWKLNLPLEKKLSVMAMFSVGLFVTAVSVYRATTFPALVASTNFTWDWTEAGLWSAIEVYVGVVCACMPGMRAFVTQVFPGRRWKHSRPKSSRDYKGSSDPSSLGTVGSGGGGGAMNRGRSDDEIELTMTGDAESMHSPHSVGAERFPDRN